MIDDKKIIDSLHQSAHKKIFEEPSGQRMIRITAILSALMLSCLIDDVIRLYTAPGFITFLYRILSDIFYAVIAISVFYSVIYMVMALISWRRCRCRFFPGLPPSPVSVIVPAYNEAKVIEKTVRAILASDYVGDIEVIVVDDGSTDNTLQVVRNAFSDTYEVRVLHQSNSGKSSALNAGIAAARSDIIVAVDADTLLHRDAVKYLARHFDNPSVAAVSGNMKVGNARNMLTYLQELEYLVANNLDRRAHELVNTITVVPGAIGAYRRATLLELGGYLSDTLAEDSELTMRILLAGYRVLYEPEAIAFTEAPETLTDLKKQRFRWSFGKLQTLWKYRGAIFNRRYGTLGLFCMPTLLLGQLVLPFVAWIVQAFPIILATKWLLDYAHHGNTAAAWLMLKPVIIACTTIGIISLLSTLVALSLERDTSWHLLRRFLLPMQIAFRFMQFRIALSSIMIALTGASVGWNKLKRTASVSDSTAEHCFIQHVPCTEQHASALN